MRKYTIKCKKTKMCANEMSIYNTINRDVIALCVQFVSVAKLKPAMFTFTEKSDVKYVK